MKFRWLQERSPERGQLLELEVELRQTREENVCLAQEISELRESARGLATGSEGQPSESEKSQLQDQLVARE